MCLSSYFQRHVCVQAEDSKLRLIDFVLFSPEIYTAWISAAEELLPAQPVVCILLRHPDKVASSQASFSTLPYVVMIYVNIQEEEKTAVAGDDADAPAAEGEEKEVKEASAAHEAGGEAGDKMEEGKAK